MIFICLRGILCFTSCTSLTVTTAEPFGCCRHSNIKCSFHWQNTVVVPSAAKHRQTYFHVHSSSAHWTSVEGQCGPPWGSRPGRSRITSTLWRSSRGNFPGFSLIQFERLPQSDSVTTRTRQYYGDHTGFLKPISVLIFESLEHLIMIY